MYHVCAHLCHLFRFIVFKSKHKKHVSFCLDAEKVENEKYQTTGHKFHFYQIFHLEHFKIGEKNITQSKNDLYAQMITIQYLTFRYEVNTNFEFNTECRNNKKFNDKNKIYNRIADSI